MSGVPLLLPSNADPAATGDQPLTFTRALFLIGKHSTTVRRLPAGLKLSLTHEKKGTHTLKVVVDFKHGHKRLSKTLRAAFVVC